MVYGDQLLNMVIIANIMCEFKCNKRHLSAITGAANM